jgi:hypothetical protein
VIGNEGNTGVLSAARVLLFGHTRYPCDVFSVDEENGGEADKGLCLSPSCVCSCAFFVCLFVCFVGFLLGLIIFLASHFLTF